MIQQQKREAIKKKVREVCGIVPFKLDDDFQVDDYAGGNIDDAYSLGMRHADKYAESDITLQHLLRTMAKYTDRFSALKVRSDDQTFLMADDAQYTHYDLTKSFTENLENDELCDFLYQLICE